MEFKGNHCPVCDGEDFFALSKGNLKLVQLWPLAQVAVKERYSLLYGRKCH